MTTTNRRSFLRRTALALTVAAGGVASLALGGADARAETPDVVSIDYAYYNPVALLLKEKGWLEDELAKDDIDVRWVLSLGSNKALEFLNGRSLDFGSTAGAASLVGKANGIPIKAVYIYSKPEWTALVAAKDSDIDEVVDLKGKRVAVTRGTDPHIFLLRALKQAGLTEDDIEPVLLQHPDGYRALEKGQVDAWAGLDPHMAKAELESGARLFFRDPDLNTYGVLNVRERFAEENPALVRRVLQVYERARNYAIEHPEELKAALVRAARLDDAVAERQLRERTDITNPAIGTDHREAWLKSGLILQEIGVIKPDIDVEATVDALIDPSYLRQVAAN